MCSRSRSWSVKWICVTRARLTINYWSPLYETVKHREQRTWSNITQRYEMIAFFRSWNCFPESKSSSLIEPISHSKIIKEFNICREFILFPVVTRNIFLYLSLEIESKLARKFSFLFAGAALRWWLKRCSQRPAEHGWRWGGDNGHFMTNQRCKWVGIVYIPRS